MDEGRRRRRGELTPEQEQERFSTGGLGFEESLRRVLTAGEGEGDHLVNDEKGEGMAEHSGLAERELADEQVMAEVARLRAGVMDGSIPIFFDAESAHRYWSERFGA